MDIYHIPEHVHINGALLPHVAQFKDIHNDVLARAAISRALTVEQCLT